MKNAIDRTPMTIRQITVHFLSLASMDLPLFLPKKVSEEPVMELIPSELLGCMSTNTMEKTDKTRITAAMMMQSVK